MELKTIKKMDDAYFMRVFGERLPVCFDHGEACYLYDTDGKKYTDFLCGIAVCALGYSDEGYKAALTDQVNKLLHTSNYFYIAPQAKLARLLCESTGYDKVFFSNSGSEAVEGAMKLARKYFHEQGQHKYEIITMKDSFHGRTLATLAATGQEKFHAPFQPLTPSFKYVPYNDIDAVQNAVSKDTCAVMLEPVIGEGGIIPAKTDYYKAIRRLCDEHGILMIADEIQTGMGRTGKLLCSMHYGVKPDITVLAKSLGNGVPIGAFLAKERIAQTFRPGDHGSTFGGNHLATAAALYMTKKVTSPGFLDRIQKTGAYFKAKLTALAKRKPAITEVRGMGLMLGMALNPDINAKDILKKLLQEGFVTAAAGNNTIRFLPPYVIQKLDIDALVDALKRIL